MKAKTLYARLEKDFIKPGLSDDWAEHMTLVSDFLSENFKKRSMGLVCDFAKEINKAYTAVFPSDKVMKEILARKETDIMLFVHHPSTWDIRNAPDTWQQMDRNLLQQFKEKRIAIYNLHVPLDNYGKYSTSVTLANALNLEIEKAFGLYYGALAGVICKTDCKTISELASLLQQAVEHRVKLHRYGSENIRDGKVSVFAGGGCDVTSIRDVIGTGTNTYITGISLHNNYNDEAHKLAKENKINILGGTHYSTEKFACIAMLNYFKKLKLPAEFIADEPVMEDL